MNDDFFFKFERFHLGGKVSADDAIDRINYRYSTFFCFLFIIIIGLRQYVFKPIQCWVPAEWPKAWEEYAENYCWVQDTYFVNISNAPIPNNAVRENAKISYYQWVPFILAVQAMFFYLPHLIWKISSAKAGFDVNKIVQFANKASDLDPDKRKEMISFLAIQMKRQLDSKHGDGRNSKRKVYNNALQACCACFFESHSGGSVVLLYLFIKLLYVANAVGQIFLMKRFLGFKNFYFGAEIFHNLSRGILWVESGVFPRVTFCDVPIRRIGQPTLRTIQCVLPVNMLNEKVYVFLWFWIVLCSILSAYSLVYWLVRSIFGNFRNEFVKRYLNLLNKLKKTGDKKAKEFVSQFLKHDGVFIMRMIASNVGDVLAAEIMDEIWQKYNEDDSNSDADNKEYFHRKLNESDETVLSRRSLLLQKSDDV